MVTQHSVSDEARYLALGKLADQVNVCLAEGRRPDMRELRDRFPELASDLEELIATLVTLKEVEPPKEATSVPSARDEYSGRIGDFQIVREIGRGGMGVVYQAHQISLDRTVALKVLPFAAILDQRRIRRFQIEARAAAQLKHPNIVSVFGVGCERSVHYYAMEYVPGRTLAEVITLLQRKERVAEPPEKVVATAETENEARTGLEELPATDDHLGHSRTEKSTIQEGSTTRSIETPDHALVDVLSQLSTTGSTKSRGYCRSVVELGIQVAKALHHAHEEGILHRDVKPSNLILDGHGKIWVTDFGLARIENDPGMTMTGDIVGTLRYMSPEQALAKRVIVDHRTDVYSLGATLYELLTLRPAFAGVDKQEVLNAIAFSEPARPRRFNHAISPVLETILLKAMAKNPAERYSTALALAEDLRSFSEDKPIKAKRSGIIDRSSKWARRHRGIVATSAVSVVVAWAMASFWIWRERTEAIRLGREAVIHGETAERHYRQTLRTVDDYFTKVSESTLLDVPSLQPLRRELLEAALGHYQEFVREHRDDPDLQADLAAAHDRLGRILSEVATAEESHAAYREAFRLWKELCDAQPQNIRFMHGLANSYRIVGGIELVEGDTEKGRLSVQEAIHLSRRLVESAPDNPKFRHTLASGWNEMARVGFVQRDLDQASEAIKSAQAVWEALVEQHPGEDYQVELAKSLSNEALIRLYQGRWDESIEVGRRAVQHYSEQIKEKPSHQKAQTGCALAYKNLSIAYRASGQYAESIECSKRSSELHQKLTLQNPSVLEYKNLYAGDVFNLARAQSENQQPEDAIRSYRECIKLYAEVLEEIPAESLDRLGPTHCITASYQRLGKLHFDRSEYTLSYEAFQSSVESGPDEAFSHAWLAWFLALCPVEEYRDLPQALRVAETAVEVDPEHATAWNHLGVARYYLSDWEGAVEALQQAETIAGHPSILRSLVQCMAHQQLGQYELAQAGFEQAVGLLEEEDGEDPYLLRLRREAEALIQGDRTGSSEPTSEARGSPDS